MIVTLLLPTLAAQNFTNPEYKLLIEGRNRFASAAVNEDSIEAAKNVFEHLQKFSEKYTNRVQVYFVLLSLLRISTFWAAQ
ncbi:hypothetical protein KC799_03680 [candidate division KSB1 bacterium]|nr:hypothetical protein [candidate division KSB1 bacterium]